jgi:hypothetical protein
MSVLFVDEIGDLAGYVLNERAMLSIATRVVPKVTIKNLSARLKRQEIYFAKEWAKKKKKKKKIL